MGRKAPRKRLACRVMCTSNGCRCTRTTLGAPPTPRFGVGEAKWITPRAKARRKRRAIVKDGLIPNRGRQRVMRGQKRVEDARERAYDPRIHLLRKKSLRRWMDCRVKPGNDREDGTRAPFSFARSARNATRGCAKSRLGQFPLFRIDINNGNCNSNVLGLRGLYHPICHPRCATIRRDPMWHHPSS